MAVGNFTVYSNAILEMSKAQINLSADTFVMVLLDATYTPVPDTDALWSSISAHELPTAAGYTAGGVVLTGVSDALATATVTFGAAAAIWSAFTATFKYAVVVRRASASLAGTDLLIAYCDCNTTSGTATVTGGGGNLTITPTGGIFTITHTP